MDLQLLDKVVLVTGSSKGIGFTIAKTLHAEGCKVILNGRNSDLLNQSVSMLPGSYGIAADVTSPRDASLLIENIIDIYGGLDALVCNVGSGQSVAPGEEDYEEWQRVFSTNLWSVTNIIESATNTLSSRKGSIVCISSICGREVIDGAPVTYSVAKSALNAYVLGISRPLGRKGVRINAVAPGNIIFDGSIWEQKLKSDQISVKKMLKEKVALNKLGAPEDVASLAAYLLSPNSNFATGSIFTIDGGQVHS